MDADGEVRPESLEERDYQARGIAALLLQQNECDGNGDTHQDLQAHFRARCKSQVAPVHDLDVVISETDAAEGERREHYHPNERIGKITPQKGRQQDRDADEHAAHSRRAGFFLVFLRPLFADVLADLKFAQLVNDERADH